MNKIKCINALDVSVSNYCHHCHHFHFYSDNSNECDGNITDKKNRNKILKIRNRKFLNFFFAISLNGMWGREKLGKNLFEMIPNTHTRIRRKKIENTKSFDFYLRVYFTFYLMWSYHNRQKSISIHPKCV